MSWTASHLGRKRELSGAVQNGRLLYAEGGWGKDVRRVDYFSQGRPPLGAGRGSYEVLIRKF